MKKILACLLAALLLLSCAAAQTAGFQIAEADQEHFAALLYDLLDARADPEAEARIDAKEIICTCIHQLLKIHIITCLCNLIPVPGASGLFYIRNCLSCPYSGASGLFPPGTPWVCRMQYGLTGRNAF